MERIFSLKAPLALKGWFLASFGLTLWYLWFYLEQAFSGDFVIQDDARQHVFWVYRYVAPGYFQNDLMAEYFEAMAPYGYRALYRTVAWMGGDPFLFNKLLPVVLALVTTYYCFRLSMRILPSPAVAFVATVLLNHMLWGHDDLSSGTPRAFVYPLLLASFFYISGRSFWPFLISLALEAAFYPHALLISLGTYMFGFLGWERGMLKLSKATKDYITALFLAGASILLLLPYMAKSGDFGPLVTEAEARLLPEFQDGGRSAVFSESWWGFWIKGRRSGFWPSGMGIVATVCLFLTISFPFLLRRKKTFALLEHLNPSVWLLFQAAMTSSLLFIAAHLLLFRLHLPSRFTQHSFRIIVALAGAITLAAAATVVWRRITSGLRITWFSRTGCIIFLFFFASILLYSQIRWAVGTQVVKPGFEFGESPALYRFLQTQPKDSMIAVLPGEADLIPSFSLRSVLIAPEYAIAYHRGYYIRLKDRHDSMIAAYNTDDPELLKDFIVKYGITHFIIDNSVRQLWQSRMAVGKGPALELSATGCTAFEGRVSVVDAGCLLRF